MNWTALADLVGDFGTIGDDREAAGAARRRTGARQFRAVAT